MTLKDDILRNNLLLPDYSKPTIVDLMREIYGKNGFSFENMRATSISPLINEKKHIIFILIDGMGSNLIASMPADNVLRNNKKCDLITVNPSSTGAVITTVATAEYPAQHGILGWYSYNRDKNIAYFPLMFAERNSEKKLTEYGLQPNDIFRTPSVMDKLNRRTTAFFPSYIVNSETSKFTLSNDSARVGYENINDAFAKLSAHIAGLNEPSFTYLYIPDIDNAEHYNGVYSNAVREILMQISREVEDLCRKKGNDTDVIITADHGQIDTHGNDVVMDFDKYSEYFYALPGIDFSTAVYYVHPNKAEEFEAEFSKDFGEKMFLHKTEEYLDLKFFGPDEVSDYMKSNLGEYISFCKKGFYFVNSCDTDEYIGKVFGNHSGFSEDELTTPLIIL